MKEPLFPRLQQVSQWPKYQRHLSVRLLVLALSFVALEVHPSAGSPETPNTERGPRLELGTLTRTDGTELVTEDPHTYVCLYVGGKSRGWLGTSRALKDLKAAREDYPFLQSILFVDDEASDPATAATFKQQGYPNIVVHSSRTKGLGRLFETPPWLALVTEAGTSYVSTDRGFDLHKWISEQLIERGLVDPAIERLRDDLRLAKEMRDHGLILACAGELLDAGGARFAPEVASAVRYLAEKNYRIGVFEFAVDLVDRCGCLDDAVRAIERSASWTSDDDVDSRIDTVTRLMSGGCPEVGLTVYELTCRKDRSQATAFIGEFRSSHSDRQDLMKQWFDYFAYSSHPYAGLPNRTEVAASFGELIAAGPTDPHALIQVSKVYEHLEDWSNAHEILGKALESMSPGDPDYESIVERTRYLKLKKQSP